MKTKTISLDQLTDILELASIVETVNTFGLIAHFVDHPTFGLCHTVQSGECCLLITCG
jgi:hypothetical protein